jgi:membrane protein DedA with SNARE-associated domain
MPLASTARTFRWPQVLAAAVLLLVVGFTTAKAIHVARFLLWDVLGEVLWVVLYVMLGRTLFNTEQKDGEMYA